MILSIARFSSTRFGTVGEFELAGNGGPLLSGYTIELPWRGNAEDESCIPPGAYRAQRHDSPTFGPTYWLRDVPGRTEVLIHAANSPTDLDGCIGPGASYGWAGDYWDGVERPLRAEHAVWDSRDTLDRLLERGADELDVEIYYWTPEYP